MELLEMHGITKSFFGSRANDCIDLQVKKGEIHALLGENGAGKTTLMNILYGLYQADEGEIFLNEKKIVFKSPEDAINQGIGMVHQHFMLVDKMTVLQNIILGLKPQGYPFVSVGKIAGEIKALSEKYGMYLDPNKRVQDLSVGIQQKVEILKALYRKAKILILDEPTAVLTPQEISEFFKVLRILKNEGHSIILICHKLSEIMEISDRVTILRDGKKISTLTTSETTESELSRLMIGRELRTAGFKHFNRTGENEILNISGLSLKKEGKILLKDIRLTVFPGEILGIAGVDGNGQGELAEVIAGVIKQNEGSISYMGQDIGRLSIRKRFEKGISYIPGDRHRDGLVLDANVVQNLILRNYYHQPCSRRTVFQEKAIDVITHDQVAEYKIKTGPMKSSIRLLSGGNQQKAILARELSQEPMLVIACQPTRGLDIGATEYMRERLVNCRERGGSILLISTDLEEILAMSDRIAVMHKGEIMGILENKPDLQAETIGSLMGGRQEVQEK